jgi:hypothetical protein
LEQTQEPSSGLETSDNQSFSLAIDLIAAEYGWSLLQILDLTVPQLNLLIETIGDRRKKDGINQAMLFRLSIVAALSKEGAEIFQQVVNETFSENRILPVTTADLSKLGLKRG